MLIRITLALSIAFFALTSVIADTGDGAELLQVILGHYHAIGENRLEEAMSFYHEASPLADSTREQLELSLPTGLHRTSTLRFTVLHHDSERAVAVATHLQRTIAGVKFLDKRIETRYVLRRRGVSWKIWASASRPQ